MGRGSDSTEDVLGNPKLISSIEYPGYKPSFWVDDLVNHLHQAAREYMEERGEDPDDAVKGTYAEDGFHGFEVIADYTDVIEFKVIPRPLSDSNGLDTSGEPRITTYPDA
jgi:hypothetical protein